MIYTLMVAVHVANSSFTAVYPNGPRRGPNLDVGVRHIAVVFMGVVHQVSPTGVPQLIDVKPYIQHISLDCEMVTSPSDHHLGGSMAMGLPKIDAL